MNDLSALLQDLHCRPKKIKLNNCSIKWKGCAALASALCLNTSHLIELDLSENNLENSGVEQFCNLLRNSNCKLEKLELSKCSITGEGYAALASALKSNPSSNLKELDLRENSPGEQGVKLLTELTEDSENKLKMLRLLKSTAAEEACSFVTEVLKQNPLLLRELDLSGKIQGDSGMKKLSALLEDSHCRPSTIRLNRCTITAEGCASLASALCLNHLHLKYLYLSENKIGHHGVLKLCPLLTCSNLQILDLSFCSVTEDGYTSLAKALKSSHLTDLDLRGNDPGESGVKALTVLLDDRDCKLKVLKLLVTPAAEEAFAFLTKALNTNPLLLKELDLTGKIQGDAELKKWHYLLEDSHCKIKELRLNKCNLATESCETIASILNFDSNNVRKIDLSDNDLQDSGLQYLAAGLKRSKCKLETLKLNSCLMMESCSTLAEVLDIKDSLLRELDLSNNELQDNGMVQLSAGLKKSTIEVIRLNNCSITDVGCDAVASALHSNFSLKELDLDKNKIGQSGVQKLSDLLKNSNCALEKLKLSYNNIKQEGYTSLAAALQSNSSSKLKELDLCGNDPGDKGVQELFNLQRNSKHNLTLRLLKSTAAENAFAHLTKLLQANPLLLEELDLSGKIQGDSVMNQLSALLEDLHCRPKKLNLKNSRLTKQGCAALTSALCKNPSHLRELDLSGSETEKSAMEELCHVLRKGQFKLHQLKLSKCSISEKDCAALASALNSNPLHLIEMDLSENKLGDAGVKRLSELLHNSNCTLKKLNLSFCNISEEGYADLTSALQSNPTAHLRELDLRGNNPGEKGMKHLNDLQKDKNCKLALRLLSSPAAEEAFASLSKLLGTNPLLLRELDLSGKIQGDSSVKQLSNLMKDSHCILTKLR
ncbi:ribonuclease inhibitor-like [Astyanax mexicanus]|uniref:Ribonuclease inhibitor-like n=1 Tax=Astyanax mexicanus TaxID=7994 RepID=A0A8T2L7L2_ASTMX|nr:ribonuclease inhibitor-like [Astyanax mexicanus]